METRTIVVLEGDDTGQELLEESLRLLAPGVTGIELELPRFDLSLEHGLGLKAATITPEGRDDVWSTL
jgi:isocitrate/isopropylmalate dehydrogenase